MPRKPGKVPSYGLHKASGRAVTRINGRDCYLGAFGSPLSYENYERAIAEWRVGQSGSGANAAPKELTINKLLIAYMGFATGYYVRNGKPSKELTSMKDALRPLRQLYGQTRACDFGPKALKALRQHLVEQGAWSRPVINRNVGRIKRLFKWAVAEELVPPSQYHGLQALRGLEFGRTKARETEPVKPVPDAWVDAVLPYVAPEIAAMIELQRLTGMRAGEVVVMRQSDIDTSGDIWLYEPAEHKNRWRGYQRQIPLGPRAQAILTPFLGVEARGFVFSPAIAELRRNALRRQNRRSKMTPSQARRRRRVNPEKTQRDRYDTDSYRRAISYGISKAKKAGVEIPKWSPLQLRHGYATKVRHRFGLESAQVALGHLRADVTQVYAERNLQRAVEVAAACG